MSDPLRASPLPKAHLVLESERLVLKPLDQSDLDLSVAIFTDERVVRFVCDVYTPEATAEHFHANDTRRGAGGRLGVWSLTRKDNGAKIGTGVLLPLPVDKDDTDWSLLVEDAYPDAEIEVGYMLLPEAWGQGFATEACQRLVQFGFENTALTQIVAVTDPDNEASKNILSKCGFSTEGLQRAYATQCSSFRLTKQDWTCHHSPT